MTLKTITYDADKWVIVPREPTDEHIRRAFSNWKPSGPGLRITRAEYKAMIEAAPQPQAESGVLDEVINALSEAGKRCQSFLDTFGDIGDCVTQADIDDWFLIEKRLRDMRGPFWTREAFEQMVADGKALTETLRTPAKKGKS